MRKWMILIVLFCLPYVHKATGLSINTIAPGCSSAVINPTEPVAATISVAPGLSAMRVKDIEKLTGIKFSLKERIAWTIYRSKLKKAADNDDRLGRDSKMMGIFSLVTLLLPIIGIFAAIPLALIAIVKGKKAKKINPDNRNAKTGIILGIITLALIVAAAIVAALVLTV